MRSSEVLKHADFGSDVAESDTQLQHYFVRTSAFKDVVHDRVDLILGPKGSGKTAIFRMLAEPQFEIPELNDCIVVPAFNVQGSVFFQELAQYQNLVTENLLRRLWTAYILALVGNKVAELEGAEEECAQLKECLGRFGLARASSTSRGIWSFLTDAVKRLARPNAIEAAAGLTPAGLTVDGRLEYGEAAVSAERTESAPTWLRPSFDSHEIIENIAAVLSQRNMRCWVIFDRLDEAFQDDRVLERAALRSLLRAHTDISSYGAFLRAKLFLRSDVLDRLTEADGFVNITHLRSLRLTWSRAQVEDLIVKRLVESDAVLMFLQARHVERSEDVLRAVMATVVEVARKTHMRTSTGPLAYMIERSTDASQDLNPRNVVSYLRIARSVELDRLQLRDVPVSQSSGPLITMESMIKAWRVLSKTRLVDTLYAEHNSLRPAFERFRNGPQRFDRAWLAALFEVPQNSTELMDVVRSLTYCGFLSETGRRVYRIPDLYRPALGLNPKWEERPTT